MGTGIMTVTYQNACQRAPEPHFFYRNNGIIRFYAGTECRPGSPVYCVPQDCVDMFVRRRKSRRRSEGIKKAGARVHMGVSQGLVIHFCLNNIVSRFYLPKKIGTDIAFTRTRKYHHHPFALGLPSLSQFQRCRHGGPGRYSTEDAFRAG